VKFRFLKASFFGFIFAVSWFANAGLITHNNYTLDTDTNVVTNNGIEWLQWTETYEQSISTALSNYSADGWVVASHTQMARLFSDFGWNNGLDETAVYTSNESYDSTSENSTMDRFIELFGMTKFKENELGYFSGDDAQKGAAAIYGTGNNVDYFYSYSHVQSDSVHDARGEQSSVAKLFGNQFLNIDDKSICNDCGVALIRVSEVSEPATLAIFALGMIGLMSRRFKKS
jgi:hypothetical protein